MIRNADSERVGGGGGARRDVATQMHSQVPVVFLTRCLAGYFFEKARRILQAIL